MAPVALDPRSVRFVLVGPQSGGNVGSAARALKNLGFHRLVLVSPECEPLGREARMLAVDAADLLEAAEIHPSLDDALAGAVTVAGLTRRMGKHRRPHWTLDRIAPDLVRLAGTGELALVFGREDHGLSDEELDRCTHLVHLDADESYPSFNLAQAVLLVGYELRRSTVTEAADAHGEDLEPPAGHQTREAMYRHLRRALVSIGFLTRDGEEQLMRRFRRLLGRAELSEGEVQMLRGVARQTLWAAERAGLELPPQDDDDDA